MLTNDSCVADCKALMTKLQIARDLLQLVDTSGDSCHIIDGGCHIGRFALEAADTFPQAQVLAFEPDPESFASAERNTASRSEIQILHCALGETEGRAEFFRGPLTATNSLLPRPRGEEQPYYPPEAALTGGSFVDVVSLAKVCNDRGIRHIDLLKLDLQGGELAALRGAAELLRTNAVSALIVEIVFVRKYEAQPLLWEIWRYLDGFGYSLYSIEEVKVGLYGQAAAGLRQGQWNQGDAIFISRDLRQALDG